MFRHRQIQIACFSAVLAALLTPPVIARTEQTPARISADELATLIARDAVIVLDVRDEAMFARGHLPGARLVPPDKWTEAAADLKLATRPIVTYCSCPAEETSLRAAARFAQLGVKNVRALTGGYDGWVAEKRRVITPETRAAAGNMEATRESWQRVPDVFAALGITPGAVVADVGAGDGFFTTRLAAAVGPNGRVLAVDISQSALDRLKTRVAGQNLTNVETVLGATDNPRLPEGTLDAALIVNAYHEMREHQSMLLAIKRALKPNGRLVILESVRNDLRTTARDAQEQQHQLAPYFLQRDAIEAGFEIAKFEDNFTKRGGSQHNEYLIVLTPVR